MAAIIPHLWLWSRKVVEEQERVARATPPEQQSTEKDSNTPTSASAL